MHYFGVLKEGANCVNFLRLVDLSPGRAYFNISIYQSLQWREGVYINIYSSSDVDAVAARGGAAVATNLSETLMSSCLIAGGRYIKRRAEPDINISTLI